MNTTIQPTERNRFSFGFCFYIAVIGIILDQVTKYFVIYPLRNYNFAFSLPVPQGLMYGIYALVLALISFYLMKRFSELSVLQRCAWSLILAGALSNVGERIVLGYVRDFIPLLGGILNIADFLIIGGIAILLYRELFPGTKLRN